MNEQVDAATTEQVDNTKPQTKSSGNFIANLKIRTRLFGGFGVILAILIIGSSLSVVRFMNVNTEITEFAKLAKEVKLAEEAEIGILKMSRSAQRFVMRHDEKDAKKVIKYEEKLAGTINELGELLKKEEYKKTVAHMKEAVKRYHERFELVVKLVKDYDHLIQDELVPEGETFVADMDALIEEAIKQLNSELQLYATQAREHALLAQVHTYRFVSEGTKEESDAVLKEFKKTNALMKNLAANLVTEKETKLYKHADENFKKYQKAFAKLIDEDKQIRQLMDVDLPKDIDAILVDADKLVKAIAKEEHELEETMHAEIVETEIEMIVIAVISLIVGIGIAFLLANNISNPIVAMTRAMDELATGTLDVEIPSSGTQDEIGDMAKSMQIFKDNAIDRKRLEEEQHQAELRAEQERKQQEEKAAADRKALLNKMADDFMTNVGSVVSNVTAASTEMEASAGSVSSAAEQTESKAQSTAAAAEQTSSNVSTVAAAAEELTSSISEISRQVSQSATISKKAVDEAQKSSEQVNALVDSANQVGEVVALITAIAEQTKLLALNATIEAARAGEAGKGFAVVASEVGNLAEQTAKATDEIASKIQGIQTATQNASSSIDEISRIIAETDQIATQIASAVEEQSAATQEISGNVEQAAASTKEVASNIVSVNEAAVEAGSVATHIKEAAGELSQQSETLQREVDKFIAEIRQ